MKHKTIHSAVISALAAFPALVAAQATATLSPVVVTATRGEAQSFDLPVAIDSVGADQIRNNRLQTNISETLNRVPGLVVQNRETYSQEQQLTLRGFGARSQFGIRGVRLVADGIPASTPDGQAGAGLIDLSTAERIEVLRGPFSALYGNHSGGVIQVFTEDGPKDPTWTGGVAAGSYGTRRVNLKFGAGGGGQVNGIGSLSRMETDGYRQWSSATKEQANAKLGIAIGTDSRLTLVGNYLAQPDNRDPLGLTAAQMAQDRRQASPEALKFRTRRNLDNLQGGITFDTRFAAQDTFRLTAYSGSRTNEQYLPTAANFQNNIRSSGAVSVLDRDFWGVGARWTHAWNSGTFVFGAEYDRANEDRRGYRSGITTAVDALTNGYGDVGALKRKEDNTSVQAGLYGQGEWRVTERWSALAGLRYTRVTVNSADRFICTQSLVTAPGTAANLCSGATAAQSITAARFNPDDSGNARFNAATPALGLVWKAMPELNVYANIGRSFETPTLIEMAYRNVGSGMNFDLKPSRSRHQEVGAKAILAHDILLNAAAFRIDTRDEIVVDQNLGGGRSTYKNAGRTQRNGLELSLQGNFGRGFSGYVAATWLEARFRENFNTLTNAVAAGNRIPGIPQHSAYAEVRYQHDASGFNASLEGRRAGRMLATDTNRDQADGYFVAAVSAGFEQRGKGWRVNEFLRVDNLTDRNYVGAVYVNDANGRYFAPAPGRSILLGASLSLTM
ncbi:MAG TPA: TonB-dependent receptor [Rhodocyclaceae bacterium]|nr:TonB-dependent receptor [Rhodocyclaceae bacterium]